MPIIKHNPGSLFPQYNNYSHGIEVSGEARLKIRKKYLENTEPSSTVVCCQLLESKWKLEIEAVAAI